MFDTGLLPWPCSPGEGVPLSAHVLSSSTHVMTGSPISTLVVVPLVVVPNLCMCSLLWVDRHVRVNARTRGDLVDYVGVQLDGVTKSEEQLCGIVQLAATVNVDMHVLYTLLYVVQFRLEGPQVLPRTEPISIFNADPSSATHAGHLHAHRYRRPSSRSSTPTSYSSSR